MPYKGPCPWVSARKRRTVFLQFKLQHILIFIFISCRFSLSIVKPKGQASSQFSTCDQRTVYLTEQAASPSRSEDQRQEVDQQNVTISDVRDVDDTHDLVLPCVLWHGDELASHTQVSYVNHLITFCSFKQFLSLQAGLDWGTLQRTLFIFATQLAKEPFCF